jgi:hypothetical protein
MTTLPTANITLWVYGTWKLHWFSPTTAWKNLTAGKHPRMCHNQFINESISHPQTLLKYSLFWLKDLPELQFASHYYKKNFITLLGSNKQRINQTNDFTAEYKILKRTSIRVGYYLHQQLCGYDPNNTRLS